MTCTNLAAENHTNGCELPGTNHALAVTAVAALRGLPWVMREGRVVPDRVEMQLRQLDIFEATPMPQYGSVGVPMDTAVAQPARATSGAEALRYGARDA